MSKRLRSVLWCLALTVFAAPASLAQQTTVVVRIEYIAGQNVYLNAGTEAGIETGDTLSVHREQAFAGTVRVVSAGSATSVVTYADRPFPLTRGETVRIVFTPPRREPAPNDVPLVKREDRPSILETPRDGTRQDVKSAVHVTGRVAVSLSSLRSTTTFRNTTERTFASPSASLRTSVTNLPGQVELNVNARATYRYSTPHIVSPAMLVRVYETSLERSAGALQMKAGRFSVSPQALGSYWDGVLLRYRTGPFGFGAAAGLEPDRADAAFSSDLPKYGLFADFEHRNASTSYVASASFSAARPRVDLAPYSYLAASQRFAWRGVRLYQTAALDRNAGSGAWTVGLLSSRVSVPLIASFRIRGRYDLHRPYAYWRAFNPISFRTERFGGGLSWSRLGMSLGGDVTWTRPESGFNARTISSFVTIPGQWLAGVGLSASMSVWENNETANYFVSGGLSRTFGSTHVRTSYALDRADYGTMSTTRHALGGSIETSISRGFHVLANVRVGLGNSLSSTSVYTSLRKDF